MTVASFADEAAQVMFALRLASDTSAVSMLLSAGLLGGLIGGPLAPRFLSRLGPLRTISSIFLVQSLLVAVASLANQLLAYILVATALGCTGSILLSAIMVAVPTLSSTEKQIDLLNRAIQTVRNLGYVGGPAMGGALYAMADGSSGLFIVAAFVFLAAPITVICFRMLNLGAAYGNHPGPDKKRAALDLAGLLHTPGVLRALAPLVATVVLTSALNVLLIIRIRNNLQFSAETYGIIVSTLSVGLIIGPLTISGLLAKRGDAAGASIAAAIIGVGLLWLSVAETMWIMMSATLLIGVANGAQNTLMASFMMKAITPRHRINQMPAYVTCLQGAVLTGFIAAAFVSNDHVVAALMFSGIATVIVGICGAALNGRNRPALLSNKGAN